MKKRTRFLALALSAVLILSLVSCGNKADSNSSTNGSVKTEESTIQEVVKTEESTTQEEVKKEENTTKLEESKAEPDILTGAQEAASAVTSVEANMTMEMDMKISAGGQEQVIESLTTMDMVCFADPMKIKMDMIMDMGELGSVSQTIYGDMDEAGTCKIYLFDGTNWQSQVVAVTDMEQYDARNSMLSFIEDDTAYTPEGTEMINGVNTYKYSNVMKGEDMKEAMFSSGALDNLASLGLDSSKVDSMLDGLGEITAYIWVEETTMYPVRYEMDMTEVMNALMEGLVDAMGEQAQGMTMNVSKQKMVMTFFNFNNATDFSIPEEVKAN